MSYQAAQITSRSVSPEQILFQQVVICALLDATKESKFLGAQAFRDRRAADSWIRSGGRDFREVCALAGIDANFVRENYINKRIDRAVLVAASKARGIEQVEQ